MNMFLPYAVSALVLAGAALAASYALGPELAPRPQETLATLWQLAKSGELFRELGVTILRGVAGIFLANVAGVTLGLAAEFGPQGVAVNALWPRTLIATDAMNMIPGVSAANGRRPDIVADAAHAVLTRPAAGFHGHFLIDDEVLAQAGVTDLSGYAVDPSAPLLPDLFLD